MAKNKESSSSGRFGPRYGVKVRDSTDEIEKALKEDHECPRCHHKKVKRESTGIWYCEKCDLKFAGGAYRPRLGRKIKSMIEEEE